MKAPDRWLQTWRIRAAASSIARGATVLDVGTADGVLFRELGDRIGGGVGIDPDAPMVNAPSYRLVAGTFPHDLDADHTFDVVTALAVFEHVPEGEADKFAAACFEWLVPGGACILTVPSPLVDHLLTVLIALRIIDGMHEAEHHGFDPNETPAIFQAAGFTLETRRKFQLGLNNLFVFRKPIDD